MSIEKEYKEFLSQNNVCIISTSLCKDYTEYGYTEAFVLMVTYKENQPIPPKPMSKDTDLNRDVQNELNEIFPEMTEEIQYYYPQVTGLLSSVVLSQIFEETMPIHRAEILRESFLNIDPKQTQPRTKGFIQDLDKYILKKRTEHDKTAH